MGGNAYENSFCTGFETQSLKKRDYFQSDLPAYPSADRIKESIVYRGYLLWQFPSRKCNISFLSGFRRVSDQTDQLVYEQRESDTILYTSDALFLNTSARGTIRFRWCYDSSIQSPAYFLLSVFQSYEASLTLSGLASNVCTRAMLSLNNEEWLASCLPKTYFSHMLNTFPIVSAASFCAAVVTWA